MPTKNWIDKAVDFAALSEAYREFAYPDPLSDLYKRTRKEKWGFEPARVILSRVGGDPEKGKPWTVGYGYTHGVTPDSRFTKEMARHKLVEIINTSIEEAKTLVTNFDAQPDAIKSVLVDMTYNMGRQRLSAFKNTLRYIYNKDYLAAAAAMEKSLWYAQVGRRARILVARVRTQEFEE